MSEATDDTTENPIPGADAIGFKGPHCPVCGGSTWTAADFRQCSQCGYLSDVHFEEVRGSVPPPEFIDEPMTPEDARSPGEGDALAALRALFPNGIQQSEPVTRLERVVIAIIESRLALATGEELMRWYSDKDKGRGELADQVVTFANALCERMDKILYAPPAPMGEFRE
jgi:hypothetical protein